jgi:predicted RNase H-like nuclease
VYFVGLDLAWGERKPTGSPSSTTRAGWCTSAPRRTTPASEAAITPYVQGDCLVAFDALVVNNPTGQRPSEAALNRDFAKFEAGAHPTNTGKPEFAGTPRAARLAKALDLDIEPDSQSPRRAIEVYPHPATVALFRLGRT